jgi:SAM-dependent methyltransferase
MRWRAARRKARARIVTALSHPERIVPDDTETGIVAMHLKRYAFALPWCEGREVLDLGCGVGYGTAFVADSARRVVGTDIDADTIAYAQRRYARPNVEFRVLDATAVPFEDASFDAVCCFETIEHVADPQSLVREAARVLRPSGALLVSTPRADRTTHEPANPHHRVEFSRADFDRLLGASFDEVEMYGERRLQTRAHRLLQRVDVLGLRRRSSLLRRASVLTGTPAMERVTLEGVVIDQDGVDRAKVLYAVCTRPHA